MVLTVKIVRSLWEKSVGLMGVRSIYPIFMITRWGVHTFGLMQTIDVVILDDDNRVVLTKKLSPNRIFFWNPKYSHVLELPQGWIEEKNITIGSPIEIQDSPKSLLRAQAD